MSSLIYTEAELLSEHDNLQPHTVLGRRLHGGINPEGVYVSPRSKGRPVALQAWTDALRARGGELFPLSETLLRGPTIPNAAQFLLLIRRGLERIFWNSLTLTGKLEAKGRLINSWGFPDLQGVIKEDISQLAIGHLGKGLLFAHGADEGGEPAKGIGGHDAMWFVARDLVFGENAFPDEHLAHTVRRPLSGDRIMSELPKEYAGFLAYLFTMMLIETRAEITFRINQEVFRTPGLFPGRQAQAELAAEMIDRIRTDEVIHLWSLRLYMGEISALTFKTADGGEMAGAVVVQRFWSDLVKWSIEEQPYLIAQKQYESIKAIMLQEPGGEQLLQEFDALSDLTQTKAQP